jgi:hypothetical protein
MMKHPDRVLEAYGLIAVLFIITVVGLLVLS